MKIKIALLGLFFANIIHPTYADQYLEDDEVNGDTSMVEEKNDAEEDDKAESEAKLENLIKLGATVTIDPAIVYQDGAFSTKDSLGVKLTFQADVPKAWCNEDAKLDIGAGWDEKNFAVKKAAITIGKMVTMGYTSSIFGYEKTDGSLLISPGQTVLQIKGQHTFDSLRIGYAIERAVALEVGLFDKNKSKEKADKSVNKCDKSDNEERPFKMKNNIPTIGINLGVVTDHLNMGLSGLARFTDYTYSADSKAKDLLTRHCFTYGAHVGVQYQVVPKKFTATGEGAYVHGLGDYLSGLSAIQKAENRKEMCSTYYLDKDKKDLSFIDAWGLGATLEYAAMPKWTFSIRGSYLTTLATEQKSAKAFHAQWNVIPKVAYEVNKYFTLSGGYSLVKEFKVVEKKNKGPEHKLYGGVKFSI